MADSLMKLKVASGDGGIYLWRSTTGATSRWHLMSAGSNPEENAKLTERVRQLLEPLGLGGNSLYDLVSQAKQICLDNGLVVEVLPPNTILMSAELDEDTGTLRTTAHSGESVSNRESFVHRLHGIVSNALSNLRAGSVTRLQAALADGSAEDFLGALPAEVSPGDLAAFEIAVQQALQRADWVNHHAEIATHAGSTLFKSEQYTKARALASEGFRMAEAAGHHDLAGDAYLVGANCAAITGSRAEARRKYGEALNRYFASPSLGRAWVFWNLGTLEFEDGHYGVARERWAEAGALRARFRDDEPMRTLASAASRLAIVDLPEALQLWLHAIAAVGDPADDPKKRWMVGHLEYETGRLLLLDLHDGPKALGHLERAISLLRHGFVEDADAFASSLFLAAEIYRDLGQPDKAAALDQEKVAFVGARENLPMGRLERILKGEQVPAHPDGQRHRNGDQGHEATAGLLARALTVAESAPDQAIDLLDQAASSSTGRRPEDRQRRCELRTLAAQLLWSQGRKALALDYLAEACAEQPSNLAARTYLGGYLQNEKRYVEAFDVGLELARRWPTSHLGFLIAGIASLKAGDFEPAAQLLEVASGLKPARQDIIAALGEAKKGKVSATVLGTTVPSAKLGVAALLDILPPTGHAQFLEYLRDFAKRVTANSDVFWESRQKRHWNPSPEKIGASLLTQDLTARGRMFRVYQETHIGGGRIDMILNVLGHEYVVELKICGGSSGYPTSYAEGGFEQLKGYMQARGASRGYLVVFDGRVNQTGSNAIPSEVVVGPGMLGVCVAANVLGIDAK